MTASIYPILYQLPARIWLEELGRGSTRCATLDQVPSGMLDCYRHDVGLRRQRDAADDDGLFTQGNKYRGRDRCVSRWRLQCSCHGY